MPMNRKLYPPNWDQISRFIRFDRAKGFCEWCGKGPHLAMIRTAPGGTWLDETAGTWRNNKGAEIEAPAKKGQKVIKVILTTAHLGTALADGTPGNKRDKSDCRPENLAALCQYCHLIFDADEHQARARNYRGAGKPLKGLKQLAGITNHAAVEFASAPPALPAEISYPEALAWYNQHKAWALPAKPAPAEPPAPFNPDPGIAITFDDWLAWNKNYIAWYEARKVVTA